jgi:hypothetical protein
MFLIAIDGREDEGAYSVTNENGEQILYLFCEEDDAIRFSMMLENMDYPEMHIIEVDDEMLFKTCKIHGYQYTVITPNDIIIPPEKNDYI